MPQTRLTSIARDPGATSRRSQRRAQLIAERLSRATERGPANQALCDRLAAYFGANRPSCIALFWPVRGEPDLRALGAHWARSGQRLALPVVEAANQPLRFSLWRPEDPLREGAYGIPQPALLDWVRPDALVIPCVGFDRRGWRLGYGGGFYDRTLAQLAADGQPRVWACGVAWDEAECAEMDPLPTDWRLDVVVTPSAIYSVTP